jgi:hypothetical protein
VNSARGAGRVADQLRICCLITLYAAMLVMLGFLIAALIVIVLLPAYRHRIERFTTEALKRSLPLTEEEIRADKDRLRADFAMEVHKLDRKLEDASLSAARQSVEINRRDAKIQELTQALADNKMSVDEHENARRVLEQAILDRLPKVEQRLAETRKLLAARDREIRSLLATSAKQAAALEEAGQINAQREKEFAKLRTTIDARSWRNRIARADERADGNVALKAELELLRAQNREQTDLIERLQKGEGNAKSLAEDEARAAEIKRLTLALAKVEAELATLKASDGGNDAERMAIEDRLADLQAASDAKSTEIAKLRAALKTYEENATEASGIVHKADLSAVQVEVEEQRRIIASLRAEIAAGQERLSRQALHFNDELRRIEVQRPGDADADVPVRKPLTERITAPRSVQSPDHQAVNASSEPDASRDARPPYLRALNGNKVAAGDGQVPHEETDRPPPLPTNDAGKGASSSQPSVARRARLIERISGLDKR